MLPVVRNLAFPDHRQTGHGGGLDSFPPSPGVTSVIPTKTNHLKIFTENNPPAARPKIDESGPLAEMLRSFRRATGWSLQYIPGPPPSRPNDLTWSTPVNPGVGDPPGHLRLDPVGSTTVATQPRVEKERAQELSSAVGEMLAELGRAQNALRDREAELAAGVPVAPRADEQSHLAARLEAVLKGGAQAVDCQAAALYLLDDATTRLKLRSCWGLPRERFAQPARPLQGALADLEAMLGHAVVLDDIGLADYWNAPEEFPAAVCVPISTPTNILGTLWIFSDQKRDFNDRQTNIIEVVAGRLAADLEREMLIRQGVEGAQLKHQLAAAERMQRNQLPSIPPLLDGWDVAGWTAQAQSVGGDFFDWFGLPDGLVAAAVGDVMDRGLEAALAASTVKAALRSHAEYVRDAAALLGQVNLTLWKGSAGDQFASLFCGLLETATGRVRFCCAGQPAVVIVRPGSWESLSQPSPPLGDSPETDYEPGQCSLKPGEALVVFTDGFRDALDKLGRPLGEAGLAEPMMNHLDLPAQDLIALAREKLAAHALDPRRDDHTVLVIKRTDP